MLYRFYRCQHPVSVLYPCAIPFSAIFPRKVGLILRFWRKKNPSSRPRNGLRRNPCGRDLRSYSLNTSLIKRDTHVTTVERRRDFSFFFLTDAGILFSTLSNATINNREGERALRDHKTGKTLGPRSPSVVLDSVEISRPLVRSVRPALAIFARDPTTAGTNTWRRCDPRLFLFISFL